MERVNQTWLAEKIRAMVLKNSHLIIAIEGSCAAGKTTLAAHLGRELSGNVIHMDDFFLRPKQRTPERMREPGGNVDYERFLREVLVPLKNEQPFSFRPYDCHAQAMADEITAEPLSVNIIEGAYSCHPVLQEYYDYRIFLTVDPEEQLRRIIARNGEQEAVRFKEKWIPLEEQYFSFHKVRECCDAVCVAERNGR